MDVVPVQVHALVTVGVVVAPHAAVVVSTMLARALTKTNHLTRTYSIHTGYRISPCLYL